MYTMYGYRERIGLILPACNAVTEPEFYKMSPEGIMAFATRIPLNGHINPEHLESMADYAENAAQSLRECQPDVMVYGCTSGSFLKGKEWEDQLKDRLEKVAGCPVLMTADNCLKALNVIGKRNVTIVTSYIDSVNKAASKYYSAAGYNVVSIKGLEIEDASRIGLIEPSAIYKLGKSAITAKTEVLFISCTGIRTIEIVEQLQNDIGIPVFSSNIACFWAALREHNLKDTINGFGDLFNFR